VKLCVLRRTPSRVHDQYLSAGLSLFDELPHSIFRIVWVLISFTKRRKPSYHSEGPELLTIRFFPSKTFSVLYFFSVGFFVIFCMLVLADFQIVGVQLRFSRQCSSTVVLFRFPIVHSAGPQLSFSRFCQFRQSRFLGYHCLFSNSLPPSRCM